MTGGLAGDDRNLPAGGRWVCGCAGPWGTHTIEGTSPPPPGHQAEGAHLALTGCLAAHATGTSNVRASIKLYLPRGFALWCTGEPGRCQALLWCSVDAGAMPGLGGCLVMAECARWCGSSAIRTHYYKKQGATLRTDTVPAARCLPCHPKEGLQQGAAALPECCKSGSSMAGAAASRSCTACRPRHMQAATCRRSHAGMYAGVMAGASYLCARRPLHERAPGPLPCCVLRQI